MKLYAFNGNLLKCFTSYLSGRKQRVTISGSTSEWLSVTSGVPQGSILGPLLFLIYVNDLPLCVKYTIVALLADNCKCLKNIHNTQLCIELQHAIDSLFECSQKWGKDFNILKCYIISFNRSMNSIVFNHTMNAVPLKRVDTVCDLGITITNSLSWNKHIESIISKASRMSGLVKRTLGWHSSTRTKYIMYFSSVRRLLVYCTPLWSGTSRKNMKFLETMQSSMTRYMLHYADTDYKDRLLQLNMLPLTIRGEYEDIVFFWKCLHGMYDINVHDFAKFSSDINHVTRRFERIENVFSPSTRKNCGEPPWPRGSVLGLRPPGLEFRILCLEGSVISPISPSSGGSPGPI